jgi:hypothetical protein
MKQSANAAYRHGVNMISTELERNPPLKGRLILVTDLIDEGGHGEMSKVIAIGR